MALAVVRSLDAPRRLNTTQELEDFEQELVGQYYRYVTTVDHPGITEYVESTPHT